MADRSITPAHELREVSRRCLRGGGMSPTIRGPMIKKKTIKELTASPIQKRRHRVPSNTPASLKNQTVAIRTLAYHISVKKKGLVPILSGKRDSRSTNVCTTVAPLRSLPALLETGGKVAADANATRSNSAKSCCFRRLVGSDRITAPFFFLFGVCCIALDGSAACATIAIRYLLYPL